MLPHSSAAHRGPTMCIARQSSLSRGFAATSAWHRPRASANPFLNTRPRATVRRITSPWRRKSSPSERSVPRLPRLRRQPSGPHNPLSAVSGSGDGSPVGAVPRLVPATFVPEGSPVGASHICARGSAGLPGWCQPHFAGPTRGACLLCLGFGHASHPPTIVPLSLHSPATARQPLLRTGGVETWFAACAPALPRAACSMFLMPLRRSCVRAFGLGASRGRVAGRPRPSQRVSPHKRRSQSTS